MPMRPPMKLTMTASASVAVNSFGNDMAASGGHGRFSRPENFTMRAASHRLSTLVMLASTAAAGGMATTRKSTRRSALLTPGKAGVASTGVPVSARKMAAIADGARQHRQITKPCGRNPGACQKRKEEDRAEGDCERQRAGQCRGDGRPMAPAQPRDHDRQRRQIEQRNRQQNARRDRSEQQSRRGARANPNEYD